VKKTRSRSFFHVIVGVMYQRGIALFSNSEKNKFKLYTKAVFKPLFIIFCAGVFFRLFQLVTNDDADEVSFYSITLGFAICFFGALFLAVIVAVMGIYKEREEKST
jgi:predicted permease